MSTPDGARRRPGRGRPSRRSPARWTSDPTRVRVVALRVLERVERSAAYADLTLHAALGRSELAPADRALVTELVYGTLRWRGRLDFLIRQALSRDPEKLEPIVTSLLRLGAYQLVFLDRVSDSAAVDQTVRAARSAGVERATGLVNAVLRRLAREHRRIPLPSLEREPEDHLCDALSLPRWLARRWLSEYGAEEAARLATACNEVPPLTVRCNPLRAQPEALLEELRERFPEARPCRFAANGLVLGHGGNPGQDPAFRAGRFTVQDEASQLVVSLLDPQPGERILDLCAAPGTKTTAIAERLGEAGEVVAVDRNPRRLALVGRDARRLGLGNVTLRELDGTQPLDALSAVRPFDRVLVDAPCSGLGTLRRNPDARWRVDAEQPARLAETQRALLRGARSVLRPGGTVVYSTCTLTREENEEVIAALVSESGAGRSRAGRTGPGVACEPRLCPVPAAGLPEALAAVLDAQGFLRCLPHRHGTDGFFAARMELAR